MKKMNKKGFTLAELLIVVAIIAVLVAIAIPVFTSQLEKSRVATDEANARSAYGEAVAKYLTLEDPTASVGDVTVGKCTFTVTIDVAADSVTVETTAHTESQKYKSGITYDGKEFKPKGSTGG
jgi:prepilin-type N-terminal cleavage/methylation domain-containing protein